MKRLAGSGRGFTILELVVALTLTGIASTAIYKSFSAQTNVYTVQGQIVDMQQNVRAGTDLMLRELRMAGCDPLLKGTAGFVTANATTVRFRSDLNKDGDLTDTNEDVTYGLVTVDGIQCLGRQGLADASLVPVAEYIDNIEFYYTLADGTKSLTPADLTKIRSVQVTLLARSATKEHQTTQYTFSTPSGANWSTNDGYKRRISTFTVKCRNMGFKS